MSEQIEIEVPGPVVRARVSVAGVETYLRKTGWAPHHKSTKWSTWMRPIEEGCSDYAEIPLLTTAPDYSRCMSVVVHQIARAEMRATHLVLADIAAEVVSP